LQLSDKQRVQGCVAEADREACAANEQGQEVRVRGKNKFEEEEHEERWRRMRL